jgi:hypothetical protein
MIISQGFATTIQAWYTNAQRNKINMKLQKHNMMQNETGIETTTNSNLFEQNKTKQKNAKKEKRKKGKE